MKSHFFTAPFFVAGLGSRAWTFKPFLFFYKMTRENRMKSGKQIFGLYQQARDLRLATGGCIFTRLYQLLLEPPPPPEPPP